MINTTDIISKVDIILQTQISVMKESYGGITEVTGDLTGT